MFLDRFGLMDAQAALWLEILISSALIVVAGAKLSRYGDVIGEKTGLGSAWVGLILLSAVTSLPELVACIGAVAIVREPDLAFGNLLGSNCFNVLIIVLLDLLQGRTALLGCVSLRHIVPAGFAVLMMALVGGAIVLQNEGGQFSAQLPLVVSLAVVAVYLLAVRAIFAAERRAVAQQEVGPLNYEHLELSGVLIRFAVAAGAIVLCGLWLSKLADILSETPLPIVNVQLGKTFVGTLLLAIVTSLPEVVVTVSCFRLGALNMAMGNLLGSNLFNMAVVPFCHLLFWGDIYGAAGRSHGFTALLAVFMTALVIIGIAARSRKAVANLGYEVVGILATYAVGLYAVYQLSAR